MNRFVVLVSDDDFKDCEPRSSRSQDSLILTKEQYRVFLESAERVGTWDKIQKSISVRCETCGSFVIPVQPFYETITQARDDADIQEELFDIAFSTYDLYEIDDLLFEKVYVDTQYWENYDDKLFNDHLFLRTPSNEIILDYEMNALRFKYEECAFIFDADCSCVPVMQGYRRFRRHASADDAERTLTLAQFSSFIKKRLAMYKLNRLGVEESGIWEQTGRTYAHILPESLYRLNILETFRQEFWEYQSKHAEMKLHLDFHHLNSSQAMGFNLLFPFLTDREFQKVFLEGVLAARGGPISRCGFEVILDKTEGTNLDFLIQFESGTRYFFELKYTEGRFGKAAWDKRHIDKLEKVYRPKLEGLVKPEALEPNIFFQNYQILRNVSYLRPPQGDSLFLIFPSANDKLTRAILPTLQLLREETQARIKYRFLEEVVSDVLKCLELKSPLLTTHYSLFAEKYLPQMKLTTKRFSIDDFSGMDTSIYWNEAKKYLPDHIDFLFIGESPPAFQDRTKMEYFYFREGAGDLLFANMMKAAFDVDYRKDPEDPGAKHELLKKFAEEEGCFLIDAVTYPINKDRNGTKIPAKEREEIIRKEKPKLLEALRDLEKVGKITPETVLILLKETVHKTLYSTLRRRYAVINSGYIGFPRWRCDPVFVQKIQQILG